VCIPKYYLLKDWNMCSMMFGCTSVSFGHQPSLGAGGDPRPLLLSDRPKPLDKRITASRGTGIQHIPNSGGNFSLSKYLFPGCSPFLSVDYAFASRIGAPPNLVVYQLRPQTWTYFEERLWCLGLFINFKTSNVLSNFDVLFLIFWESRYGTKFSTAPVCACTHLSMTY
jgi:hypothetical protein